VDADRLRSVPIFAGLGEEQLERIAELGEELEVPAGAALTSEGEFGYSFFVVEEGAAEVTEGATRLGELGPGDFFGEIALLITARLTASVTSTTPMRLFALFERDLRRLLAELPGLEDRLRRAMADRFGAQAPQPAG
jgi:CRP-like cAMP-binding protein